MALFHTGCTPRETNITWYAGEMMHLKDVPKYAYSGFLAQKPTYICWSYRLLSYIIAPLYVTPRLKRLVLGKPIRYCAANSKEQERERICDYLMKEITALAYSLPAHTVVPYKNIPKKNVSLQCDFGGDCRVNAPISAA
ncbi:MAG: hypothetical protein IKL38_07825 [Firmicutes bacterium]|nr:hypothetical protein [Bacillota bacterium]